MGATLCGWLCCQVQWTITLPSLWAQRGRTSRAVWSLRSLQCTTRNSLKTRHQTAGRWRRRTLRPSPSTIILRRRSVTRGSGSRQSVKHSSLNLPRRLNSLDKDADDDDDDDDDDDLMCVWCMQLSRRLPLRKWHECETTFYNIIACEVTVRDRCCCCSCSLTISSWPPVSFRRRFVCSCSSLDCLRVLMRHVIAWMSQWNRIHETQSRPTNVYVHSSCKPLFTEVQHLCVQ